MNPSEANTWTPERLLQLITDKVEESLQLEYKGANALGKQNNQKAEITKDVSAMANSVGGTLIYGIAEHQDPKLEHLPERLDPFSRNEFSREWLEQIIHTIQPRIEGVTIYSLVDDSDRQKGYFVVKIPQSSTAHQARDHRYYKRHNFMAVSMEDYEIRDIMNRRQYPSLLPKTILSVSMGGDRLLHIGIKGSLKNNGLISARETYVEVKIFGDRVFQHHPAREWVKREFSNGGFICGIAIHPREEIPFLQNSTHAGGYQSLSDLPETVRLSFRIFARDAPAQLAELTFTQKEMQQAAMNSTTISREAEAAPFDG